MSADDIVRLNIAEALEAVEQRSNSIQSLLDKYEQAIIYEYSSVAYSTLNLSLRTNPNAPLPEFGRYLEGVLQKLPPYKGMVYRSVTLTEGEISRYTHAWKTKQPIVEPFFGSTSRSRGVATKFGNTLFRIVCRSGRAIADYSKHPNEDEILISCGSAFSVKQVDRQHDGSVVITMTEI